MKKDNIISFKNKDIFIGMDVHLKNWKVSIHSKDFEHATFVQNPDAQILSKYLKRNFPDANYHSVYEAGYFGYWIHEDLQTEGINNIIVNPADIPTTSKEKQFKTDKRDCRKLARGLKNGELEGIYIPDKQVQQDRILIRSYSSLTKKTTRCKNQIKSLLRLTGNDIPEDKVNSHWSRLFINWLESIKLYSDSSTIVLKSLVKELNYLRELKLELTRSIRKLSETDRYREKIEYLRSTIGIGLLTGMAFLTEIVDMRRFRKLDNICSYIGLVPSEHSSGEKEKKGQITSRGNKFLRHKIIECAWRAVKKDPALYYAYTELTKRMKKQDAIIRIARKLLNRVRYVMLNNKPYEPMVV